MEKIQNSIPSGRNGVVKTPRYPRGKLVTLTVSFDDIPDEVFFSYIRPGEARAIVDPGSKHPGTRIKCIDSDGLTYQYVIHTRGFRGGLVKCHMWSESGCIDSEFFEFEIEDAPAQLL